jgi:hypothetical protein
MLSNTLRQKKEALPVGKAEQIATSMKGEPKSILIVTASFTPEISPRAFRATELACELARQGHSVTVITPRNKAVYSRFWEENRLNFKDMGNPRWKVPGTGGSTGRRYGVLRLIRQGIARMLEHFLEYPDIQYMFMVRKALLDEGGHDLLISVAVPYPVHWGVALARTPRRRIADVWVADCGDPYMGNTLDRFRKPFYFAYVEKWFMRRCDFISITREAFRVNYYPEFHAKMVEIPQGFRFIEVKPAPEDSLNGIPRFAFAGSFIRQKRDPGEFLAYLATLRSDFRFILFTQTRELIDPFVPLLNGKLEIRDYIPREELLPQLAGMDFLVNFGFDPQVQSPSKLIDYALAGRPVLHIPSSGMDTKVIDAFLAGDYHDRFELNDLERYRVETVSASFLKLLDG